MHVTVRPMRDSDLDEGIGVLAEVANEGLWVGTEAGFDRAARRALWEQDLAAPDAVTLVVEHRDTGRLVGHGRVVREPYGVAELGMVLAASARGQGIGGRLLDALIEAAGGLGAHKVQLQVWPHNEPAIRLYLSRGFVVEGRLRRHYRRANGELWDSILMGKELHRADEGEPAGSGLPDAASLPPA